MSGHHGYVIPEKDVILESGPDTKSQVHCDRLPSKQMKTRLDIPVRSRRDLLLFLFLFFSSLLISCRNSPNNTNTKIAVNPYREKKSNSSQPKVSPFILFVAPENPAPGEPFRIIAAGHGNPGKTRLEVLGPEGEVKSAGNKSNEGIPSWRIDDFQGGTTGKYKASLIVSGKETSTLTFEVTERKKYEQNSQVWQARRGWDGNMELLYSAWINALFSGRDENSNWKSLNEVSQDRERNFLYNYLSLGEDEPENSIKVVMQPDCADNPFFLRAYFSWKLGLPFGYHVCDRGSLYHFPSTGKWITNETDRSDRNQIKAFNIFLRKIMDGVHSGTARTALDDETSDYYPVALSDSSLIPGIVYADPYGHTLVLVGRIPQKGNKPGLLLAVDAQPDGTIGIKRFWKGNFLFNTEGVIGEPGFRAFRPVSLIKGKMTPFKNIELTRENGFTPYSLEQRDMETDKFYRIVGHVINPEPMDAGATLLGLIDALHELLKVRVISVENGESYFRSHPGAVIPMPSAAAAIFQAGGLWEAYSTPNRDLRLLIAMDEVINFPARVIKSPDEFNISGDGSAEKEAERLRSLLEKRSSELSITYRRSDVSDQTLTVKEILERRDEFEMAYNPNDGAEIRWGAPANSMERLVCRRKAPSSQIQTMNSVRHWFSKRLHPPT